MCVCLSLYCVLLLISGVSAARAAQAQPARKGYDVLQAGDLKTAEAELLEAVRLAPTDAVPLVLLGTVYGRQGKIEAADDLFEKALKLDPGDLNTRYNLAAGQFRLGKPAAARTNLERILKSRPDHQPSLLLLGMVLESLNDCSAAIRAFEAVPDLVRRRPDTLTAFARCDYATGRTEAAHAALESLRSFGPEAVFAGAKQAAAFRDFDDAEALLTSIRATHPAPAEVGFEIARVQYNAGRFAECAMTLEELIQGGAPTARIYDLLGWANHRRNRLPEALAAMRQAIELEPSSETNYLHLAQILLEHKDQSGAAEAVRRALVIAPGSAYAHRTEGQVEQAQGLLRQAAGSYAKAVALDGNDSESLLLLGKTKHILMQPAEAAATLEAGLARFPRDPRFPEAYGRMLLDSDTGRDPMMRARAVALLEKALALDGSLPDAHYQLGKILLDGGRTSEALPHLQAAAKGKPQSRKVHLALATAYRSLDRNEDYGREVGLIKMLLKDESEGSN